MKAKEPARLSTDRSKPESTIFHRRKVGKDISRRTPACNCNDVGGLKSPYSSLIDLRFAKPNELQERTFQPVRQGWLAVTKFG